MSFSELLTKVRMEAAISLILTTASLSSLEISERVGYKSQHYFCKVFKDYTGMTPTAYKKNYDMKN
jgi:two-component system response regulator YesN